jgi:hypothetical protein
MNINQIPFSCKEGDVVCCDIANTRQFFVIKNNQLLTLDGRHPVYLLDHFKADYQIVPVDPKPEFSNTLKCVDCPDLNSEKTVLPCSGCSHRPHELCTEDRFREKVERVLTAEEYAKEMFDKYFKSVDSALPWYIKISNKMHQNGRLERDLEFRKAIKKVWEAEYPEASGGGKYPINEMTIAVFDLRLAENLKPLKAE